MPIKIDIIKHKNEIDGKSTAGHAAVLAPNDVMVYIYPDIPTYDTNDVVLVYPSYDAIEVNQLFEIEYRDIKHLNTDPSTLDLPKGYHKTTLMTKMLKVKPEYRSDDLLSKSLPINRVIFIDSTWNQSKGIFKDDRIRHIPCVVLQNRISQFWRHQKGSPRWYLSTIEAVHQFLLEIHLNMWGVNSGYWGLKNCFSEQAVEKFRYTMNSCSDSYNGQYDNLLFFFKHMYHLIHEYYDHKTLYAYQRRLR